MSEIFTFEKIYRAYLDCRRTKRKTVNALRFEYNLERNISQLHKELELKTYKPGKSICFVVKHPSPREIFAASFKDRVVHHVLIREIEKIGDKIFSFDSFSCRKNKGTHSAVRRLKYFDRKASRNNRDRIFYIKLDISGFFMAINHDILYSIFEKIISKQNRSREWKDDVLWLAKVIIFHRPTENYAIKGDRSLFNILPYRKSLFHSFPNKGLPIGNYSSQFFANLFLNELDNFVKRELKCKYYVRYVDDFIMFDKDINKLKYFEKRVCNFLKNKLDLELNFKKTEMQPFSQGIEFLGYFIKPDCILVKQNVVGRLKRKLKLLESSFRGSNGVSAILATLNSYYGHFKHASTFNLRKNIFENKFLPSCFIGAQPDYNKIILQC